MRMKSTRGRHAGLLMTAAMVVSTLGCVGLDAQEADAVSDMQERMRALTQPGEHHEALARYVGTWNVEIVLTLPGSPEQRANGSATYEWLIPGRWIAQRLTDDLFGQAHESFSILGYDSYAQSHVLAGVSSFDNAFNVSRGPVVDSRGDVSVTYGLLDEYLTGELHKPYKVVTRIVDRDHHVVETWDLGIGVTGAKILEYRYTRRP